MEQRNIEVMDIIVDRLIDGDKLSKALEYVYNKRVIHIPCNMNNFNVSVQDLKMSRRTTNALMRNKLTTLGDVVSFCSVSKITEIATLGKTCGIELFETILDYCWDHMSPNTREMFLLDIVERNSKNIREEIV